MRADDDIVRMMAVESSPLIWCQFYHLMAVENLLVTVIESSPLIWWLLNHLMASAGEGGVSWPVRFPPYKRCNKDDYDDNDDESTFQPNTSTLPYPSLVAILRPD